MTISQLNEKDHLRAKTDLIWTKHYGMKPSNNFKMTYGF